MGVKNFNGTVDTGYLKEVAEIMKDIKERTYRMMGLSAGARGLDIGCGPGVDVTAMAGITGPGGKAVGLDNDEVMLEEARRNQVPGTEFVQGDVQKLPFPDAYFDAARAERLFQVLPPSYDMDIVFNEMVRVVKKKGKVVLCDTDWGSASVNFPDCDLTNRLLHFFARNMRPNGYSGRQLSGLVKRNGLIIEALEVVPLVMDDFSHTVFGPWLINEAIEKKVATKEEMNEWEQKLSALSNEGLFFSTVNIILVCAVVP